MAVEVHRQQEDTMHASGYVAARNAALNALASHIGKIICLIAALLLFWWSSSNYLDYQNVLANRPSEIHVSIWTTPLTIPDPVISFDSGKPAARITFERFKEMAADKPFQSYYWQGWRSGQTPTGNMHWYITYHLPVHKGDTLTYYVAYVLIPNRMEENKWSTHTVFDSTKNEFVSLVDEPHKFDLRLSWLLYIFAWGMVALAVAIALSELPWRRILRRS